MLETNVSRDNCHYGNLFLRWCDRLDESSCTFDTNFVHQLGKSADRLGFIVIVRGEE